MSDVVQYSTLQYIPWLSNQSRPSASCFVSVSRSVVRAVAMQGRQRYERATHKNGTKKCQTHANLDQPCSHTVGTVQHYYEYSVLQMINKAASVQPQSLHFVRS